MPEFTIKDGHIEPALPITDIRINVFELVEGSITMEGTRKVFRGKYADGGTMEITMDISTGEFQAKAHGVLTQLMDGDDHSHTVLTYLPKKKHISKKTH